ncbi:MAG TPA: insulinase family protein [Nannocystaceae bacterium]|nr:insulinase family protein [Nannocystaceae bacterium]
MLRSGARRGGFSFGSLAVVALLAGACEKRGASTVPPDSTAKPATEASAPVDRDAVIAASDLPRTFAKPLAGDPMEVTIHRLSNGMTVYISTDRQKPRFTAWIAVRAGSRHDPATSTGLAHYLEHMLFKGSDEYGTLDAKAEAPHVERVRQLYADLRKTDDADARAKILKDIDDETQQIAKTAVPNEYDRMFSAMGVEGTNAFTSDEQTVYVGDIPANRLEAWATVEAERFADPVFRLFFPELEAVYEEKNLSLDRPQTRVSEALMLALMPKHPYGNQTTIGSVEHLKTPAYQDMSDFFDRWYVPNNMAIILAGDIDAATALPVLEEKFARLEPKALPKDLPGEIVPVPGKVVREVTAEGEESVTLAWLTVPSAHADEPVLAVMDRMLDDARVGLINTELELTQKVPEAGSYSSTQREAGYFVLRGRAKSGQKPEEVEALLLDVVAKLKAGDFTDADVEAAKLQETVRRKLQLEFPWARASEMMDAFTTHREWSDMVERDAKFQEVTRQDLVRVANQYLKDDRVVVYRRKGKVETPKIPKPTITPVKIDPSRKSAFGKKIEAMPARTLEPQWAVEGEHYSHGKLPAGDLIAAKNERNDLFSLSYQFKRGYRKEPLLCFALELLELSGAGDQDAEAFQKRVYALGTTIETSCDAEYSSIQISGPDAQLEPALALMDEWLAAPSFADDDVKRLHENTVSKRRDQLEEDYSLSSALDGFAKYERRSSWLSQPSNKALAKAKPKALRKLMTSLLDHEHRTMYFGPRAADDVAKVVPRGKKHRRVGDVQVRVYRKAEGPRFFFLHKDGAKANVRFVIPQPPLAREARPTADLYSEYLSGSMSALVFQEIRESRGLAYSAFSTYDTGDRPKDASGLLGFMSTQADKTPVAVDTFLGLLRATDVQTDRLAIAKTAVDQEYRATRLDPRWITYWVASWDDRGEASDPRPWEWQTMAKLGETDLEGFAKRFADAPVIIAIVGDRSRVGMEALAKIAPVQELQAADLFSYGPFPEMPTSADPAAPRPHAETKTAPAKKKPPIKAKAEAKPEPKVEAADR